MTSRSTPVVKAHRGAGGKGGMAAAAASRPRRMKRWGAGARLRWLPAHGRRRRRLARRCGAHRRPPICADYGCLLDPELRWLRVEGREGERKRQLMGRVWGKVN
ncbi:hypothetical protein DAI22_04g276800 [Oryza sativa Japonica Group]|nr:hypothetical protein DAI22_04g276800 [Oryza sativa Japonica Group]